MIDFILGRSKLFYKKIEVNLDKDPLDVCPICKSDNVIIWGSENPDDHLFCITYKHLRCDKCKVQFRGQEQ